MKLRELPTNEASLAQMRDFFTQADGPAKKQVPLKTDSKGIPPDVVMILHKVNKGISIRRDEYNKLLQYKLELDMSKKESVEISEQQLDEVNMSPTNLRKLAAGIDARAGMEFEMIVPNMSNPDDGDYEADYDQDERATSISQIIDFFEGGDSPNSGRELERLRDKLYEAFYEWSYQAVSDLWDRDGEDFLRDYIENNNEFDRDEAMRDHLESMGLDESEIDEAMEAGNRAPMFSKLSDKEAYIAENPAYGNWVEADNAADEAMDEFVANVFQDYGSSIRESAFEEFEQEQRDTLDESDWLRDEGMRYMSDVESNFDVTWPYYTSSGGGEADLEQLADEFGSVVGRGVNYSSSYHGGRRDGSSYVIEPDGSLDPDDSDDTGLEFVSPPLPIVEMLDDLKKTVQWAGKFGCYTNKSTGLHMNVSVPSFTNEKLDYVKLALLLGDEYILNQFGRAGNTYCKSAMAIVRDRVRERPEDAQAMLQKMKSHLDDMASKVIHSGSTHKYTSINTKDGYVEFRSPGGDWLQEYSDDPGKLENTLLRFVVALDAACDPEKYRQDYLKKLYAILQPKTHNDTLAYFAQFAAGAMPKAALKSFVRQAQLERNVKKGNTGGKKFWWNVQWDANRRIEVVAGSKEVALQVAAEEWDVPIERLAGATVTPLRPYQEPESKPQSSPLQTGPGQQRWKILMGDTHVFTVVAANQGEANQKAREWLSQRSPEFRQEHAGQEASVVPEQA